MRARIKQVPSQSMGVWHVETKHWYQLKWQYRDSCLGDNAQERAMQLAEHYLSPRTIEVKQHHYGG
jgi:hypothetical protein